MKPEMAKWVTVVGAALRERRVSNNAAAQMVGVSPATFAAWMSGATRPNVESLPAIAKISGLALWRLHELAGYLPENYSPAVMATQAIESQQRLFADVRRWSEQALNASGLGAAARAAGLILRQDPGWQVTIRPELRGIEHALAPHTVIGLERSRPSGESLLALRQKIENELGEALAALGVIWRHHDVPGWRERPALLLEVPEDEQTRGRGLAPMPGFPTTVVTLGIPWTHAELVGSLIADAIDYGYRNMKTDACAEAALVMGADQETVGKAAAQIFTSSLLAPRSRLLDRMVWSCAFPDALTDVIGLVPRADAETFIIYVRVGPQLVRRSAEVSGYDTDKCLLTAKNLESACEALPSGRGMIVDIPDARVFADDDFELFQHRMTDAAVDAAMACLRHLLDVRNLPTPAKWKGYLGRIS